jgi:hypothetical protein
LIDSFVSHATYFLLEIPNGTSDEEQDIYAILNVQPQTRLLFPKLKRWSWRLHARLLPLLHLWETSSPKDVHVNLRVLWNKALTSVDSRSLAYEHPHFWTYHMLPFYSRWILKVHPSLFPRWLHAIIELRTVYLNQAIEQETQWALSRQQQQQQQYTTKIRLVVLGGGYDTRSIRLLANGSIQEAWELDLPQVIESKSRLLKRMYRRIPNAAAANTYADSIHLQAVDLNQLDQVESILTHLIPQTNDDEPGYTILVSEALFMYLDAGVPAQLLKRCGEIFGSSSSSSSQGMSFCFADRFDDIRNQTEEEAGRRWLAEAGWDLVDWLPNKPGSTRHAGIARR